MKIKTIIHIHAQKYSWNDHTEYLLFNQPLENTEYRVYIGEQEIEITIPDNFDPRPAQIAALRDQQTKAAADYQKTVTDIQRRIAELQAIEFTA